MRDPGPAGDERDPRRLLVEVALVVADPVLAAQEAVVGEEEDVGVLLDPVALDLVDQGADALVDGEQRLPGAAALAQRVGDLARGQRLLLGDRRGLSETSASLNEGGSVLRNLPFSVARWRGAGTAARLQERPGSPPPPPWGAA